VALAGAVSVVFFDIDEDRRLDQGASAGLARIGARVTLSSYTTLGLGGPVDRFVEATSDDEVIETVRAADRADEPVLVLGGGSNLVVADDGFPGTVVHVATEGVVIHQSRDPRGSGRGGSETVAVTVAAGVRWDRLVTWSVSQELRGIECLAGIPGLAGATPIQNVGAYGQEVSDTIVAVRAFDRDSGEVVTLSSAQCEFGYRDSMLKRAAAGQATGRYVVLKVTFALERAAAAGPALSTPVRYPELVRDLGVAPGDRVPLEAARDSVLALRRKKGMLLDPADPDTRSAGSFFTNPVLTPAQFADVQRRAARRCGPRTRVPHLHEDPEDGALKISAAWLIERAGFGKGFGNAARISTKHALALTNPGSADTAALLELARLIRAGVRETFGVELTNEPVLVGVSL
jgi:UDP-N-acetylmuramate dehydrogenase